MGSGYSSHTNLLQCSGVSFDSTPYGTIVRWGDFEATMSNWQETYDTITDFWGAEYKIGQKSSCSYLLNASSDYNGVESIHLTLLDSGGNDNISFQVEIRRDGRQGLRLINGYSFCSRHASVRNYQNYSIQTDFASYDFPASQRSGLLVLEMKKNVYSDFAFMMTLAHYYLTKDIGLSVVAKIGRDVEVEGPFIHPATELRKVVIETRRTGVWTPAACSHCDPAKASTSGESGVFRSLVNPRSYQPSEDSVGCMRSLLSVLPLRVGEEVDQGSNENVNSSNNKGNRNQNIVGEKINSGSYSGDGNKHRSSNNYGGKFYHHRIGALVINNYETGSPRNF